MSALFDARGDGHTFVLWGSWCQKQITTLTPGSTKPQCLSAQILSCIDGLELQELLPCVF